MMPWLFASFWLGNKLQKWNIHPTVSSPWFEAVLEMSWKNNEFADLLDIQQHAFTLLNDTPENDFQQCF